MVKVHPNETVYFNELEGGVKNAYGNYETDYYMNSIKPCADWLKKNVLENSKDTLIIGSNVIKPMIENNKIFFWNLMDSWKLNGFRVVFLHVTY